MTFSEREARLALSTKSDNETLLRRVVVQGAVAVAREQGLDNSAVPEMPSDIRFVIPGDVEWPQQLNDLSAPPVGLYIRGNGDLRMIAVSSVAIVGSRACSGYGQRAASELASDLADRGWSVISGAAFGIDAAAHRGTLAADGLTAAVLASGVDEMYPRAHHDLAARIMDEGVLVSEVPPGSPPTRARFLTRNRLIAALTRGTVIVEAALRSGSLRTAAQAEELMRVVMGIPGPIDAPSSAGVHQWIAQRRAELVTSAREIIELVGPIAPTLDL